MFWGVGSWLVVLKALRAAEALIRHRPASHPVAHLRREPRCFGAAEPANQMRW